MWELSWMQKEHCEKYGMIEIVADQIFDPRESVL